MISKKLYTGWIKFFGVGFLLVFFGYMNNFAQTVWNKYESQAVLQPGSPGEWDDASILGGCVIYDGTIYKMWYGGKHGSNFRIGYATSPDGVNWTKDSLHNPVLDIGPLPFESFSVNYPQVYFDGSIYHMWYVGSNGGTFRIGYAESTNGIDWTKHGQPVLQPGSPGEWDDQSVATGPVQFNGTNYEMIYGGNDGQHWQGGYATSPDGIVWTKDSLRNPVLQPGSSGSWDYPNIHSHSVVYNSYTSKYYLYFSAGEESPEINVRIGYATADSFSGIWTKNPLILIDTSSGGWDSRNTAFPFAIYDPDDTLYKMWYTGSSVPSTSDAAIGYATAIVDTTTTPVELTTFTAVIIKNEVLLNWLTATELNNHGFEIQRSDEDNYFVTIGFVKGNGTSTEKHNYTYTDRNLNRGKYYYRLKQVDFNGSYEYSKTVEVIVSPNSFYLKQNYPDPFNPTTTIKYSIPNDGMVSLKVYDILGKEVLTLVNENQKAGEHSVYVNASSLSSGVYIYRLKGGSFNASRKMVLLK